MWFCSALIAWPLSVFYREPALIWLVPTVGATAALNGFNSTSLFTLSRRLLRGRLYPRRGRLLRGEHGRGPLWVWRIAKGRPADASDSQAVQDSQLLALAVGTVCASVFETVVSYLILPGFQHRLCLERIARGPHCCTLGAGCSSARPVLSWQFPADRLVVGRISLDVLGLPRGGPNRRDPHLVDAGTRLPTGLPAVRSRLARRRGLRTVFARVHPLFTGFAALLATGLASTGPTLVHCLYRDRYGDAGGYMQLLTVSAWFSMLQRFPRLILLATGRTRALAIGQALRLVSLPPLLLGGFPLGGLPGMILGFAAAEFIRYAFNVWPGLATSARRP